MAISEYKAWLFLIAVVMGIFVGIFVLALIWKIFRFFRTEYYQVTHNGFLKTHGDKGRYGEFLIYKHLKYLPQPRKFLFNVYLPAQDGETTELDVLLLHPSGIYVFESKNYSGWIFGTDTQRQWTQTLPTGRGTQKVHFLNPIFQNAVHVRWLKAVLTAYGDIPCHSIIVFSNRCQLKIQLSTEKALVVQREEVCSAVFRCTSKSAKKLNTGQIQQIYDLLYPYTQVPETTKCRHVEQIREKYESEVGLTASHSPQPMRRPAKENQDWAQVQPARQNAKSEANVIAGV